MVESEPGATPAMEEQQVTVVTDDGSGLEALLEVGHPVEVAVPKLHAKSFIARWELHSKSSFYFLCTSINLKSMQAEYLSNVIPPSSRSTNYIALRFCDFPPENNDFEFFSVVA